MNKTFRKITLLVIFIASVALLHALVGRDKVAISKDGVRIAYSVYGKGEPALVFVHGLSGDRSVWHKQAVHFKERYRVIVLDLAGHGSSGKQRKAYAQEAFGEDISAVVIAAGSPQNILIGHSMSGTGILEANRLLKGRVSGLVAIDTLENFELILTSQQAEEFVAPFKKDFKKAMGDFVGQLFTKNTDPRIVRWVRAKMLDAVPEIAISSIEYYVQTPVIPLLSDVKVPLWCLSTDLWQSFPEINKKYSKYYNLRIMPGLGHFPMLEAPDKFNRELEDIIHQIKEQNVNGV